MADSSSSSNWTWEQNKAFEKALVRYPENALDRWKYIAADIPGNKHIEEVQHHYKLLLDDIGLIESGKVPLPCYNRECKKELEWETRKGVPWTEEEHTQFLLGLQMYGKGDWKSISKVVKTRTPTQVASHAQKFFKRQTRNDKDTRRSSIFDITTTNNRINDNDVEDPSS